MKHTHQKLTAWALAILVALPFVAPTSARAADVVFFTTAFTQADGVLPSPWVSQVAGITVVSNQAKCTTGGAGANPGPCVTTPRQNADTLVEARIVAFNSSNSGSMIARFSSTTEYVRINTATSGNIVFQKCTLGAVTTLKTVSGGGAITVPYTMGLRFSGDNIEVFVDGVTRGSLTNSFLSGNLSVGLCGGNSVGAIWDDFTITTLDTTPPPPAIPPPAVGISNLPAPPRTFLNFPYTAPAGAAAGATVINVTTAAEMTAALSAAGTDANANGVRINVTANATITVPTSGFILPNRTVGGGWIYIVTTGYSSLPAEGTRVSPLAAGDPKLPPGVTGLNQQQFMPHFVTGSSTQACFKTVAGAHHIRFVGCEFTTTNTNKQVPTYNIVKIGDSSSNGQTTLATAPHDIVFDRIYLHGNTFSTTQAGLSANAANFQVTDSWCSDVHHAGADSQAVCGWNGPGPFKIVNNYLEASGENFMLGGTDSGAPELMPQDLQFEYNWCYKPRRWQKDSPEYLALPAGEQLSWVIKNVWELKSCSRALVRYNKFENCWVGGQSGLAIKITSTTPGGNAPWNVSEDILFQYNWSLNCEEGLLVEGRANLDDREFCRRIRVIDNLWTNISNDKLWFFSVGSGYDDPADGQANSTFIEYRGPEDIAIEHNTALNTGVSTGYEIYFQKAGTGLAATFARFTYQNNIAGYMRFGVTASGAAVGGPTITSAIPDGTFTSNIHYGTAGRSSTELASYPVGNTFLPAMTDVGFTSVSTGNYALPVTSPYHNTASDGTDYGARGLPALGVQWALAVSGAPAGSNTPPAIFAAGGVNRTRSATGTVATIATVSDSQDVAAALTVTALTVPANITVTSITNTSGVVTATIAAGASATLGVNTLVFQVADTGALTATANFLVTVTTPPTISLSATSSGASLGVVALTVTPPSAATPGTANVTVTDVLGNPIVGSLGVTPYSLLAADSIILSARSSVDFTGSVDLGVPSNSRSMYDVHVASNDHVYVLASALNPSQSVGQSALLAAGINVGAVNLRPATGRFITSIGTRPPFIYVRVNRTCVDRSGTFLVPEWTAVTVAPDGTVSVLLPDTSELLSVDGLPVLLELASDPEGVYRIGVVGFTTPAAGAAGTSWAFAVVGTSVVVIPVQ